MHDKHLRKLARYDWPEVIVSDDVDLDELFERACNVLFSTARMIHPNEPRRAVHLVWTEIVNRCVALDSRIPQTAAAGASAVSAAQTGHTKSDPGLQAG